MALQNQNQVPLIHRGTFLTQKTTIFSFLWDLIIAKTNKDRYNKFRYHVSAYYGGQTE